MNKTTITLVIVITALSFILGATMQGKAQEDRSYTSIVPFVTSNDRVGFFDRSDGRIYVYDSNISKCLFIGKIQSLGQPIVSVAANVTSTNL